MGRRISLTSLQSSRSNRETIAYSHTAKTPAAIIPG